MIYRGLFIFLLTFVTTVGQAQLLPDFHFHLSDQSELNKSKLLPDKPILIFYFDPSCAHCIYQAQWIQANQPLFTEINLIWVCSQGTETELTEFRNNYFNSLSYCWVCEDSENNFQQWFGFSEIPAIYAYNSQWQFTNKFTEAQTTADLLKAVY